MNFLTAVKTCFRKYFVFSGRARRSEYWWFFLFNFLVGIVLSIVDAVIFNSSGPVTSVGFSTGEGPISGLYNLAVFIPGLSVSWRRLHDIERSGWWIGGLFLFIPVMMLLIFGLSGVGAGPLAGILTFLSVLAFIVYTIVILVFLCTDSQKRDNKYGPSPKYGSEVSTFD